MDQALFGLIVPGVLTKFGLSLQAVGLILTISFAAAASLVIPAAAADRFGRVTLCALLLLSAIMVGMQGLAAGVLTLTLFRALGFGFSAGLSPVTNALVVEHAEHCGMEFALSMTKQRGFGGESEFWDHAMDSSTLMAGLASVTSRIKLFASPSVLTFHSAIVAR